jgi:hypothetical protein
MRIHVNFEVPEELKIRWDALPWGFKTHTLEALVRRIVRVQEKYGNAGLGALMSGDFDIVPRGVQPVNTNEKATVG